ncbi:hypothetical protein V496_01259 [Pseudogymnoascus sp. VKM F-4515 (FW-2607)]|nr:hypothetical protein V496_01259 [Pseudogymnoascus sp. VKM F-4515 (FW-2607)]KFY77440.1 hypothetical protein V498_09344 [Pseudogymnoascus sp. VKM F-4517 (FW-2822)]
MAPRQSNIDRAQWRSRCREKLSEHIKTKLGITVDPLEIRLITREQDPYSWQYLPAASHLFQKNLSNHSIGAYMELHREIGSSFEAVAKEHMFLTRPAANFMDKIIQIEEENLKLVVELNKCKVSAAIDLTKKQEAEEVAKQVTTILHTVNIENQCLKEENQKWISVAEDFRAKSAHSYLIVDEASLILDKLKSSLHSTQKIQNLG